MRECNLLNAFTSTAVLYGFGFLNVYRLIALGSVRFFCKLPSVKCCIGMEMIALYLSCKHLMYIYTLVYIGSQDVTLSFHLFQIIVLFVFASGTVYDVM